jgi:hypothetical protein
LIGGLALFGLYLPSSIAGVISYPLSVIALVGTMAGLLIVLVTSSSSGPRRAMQAAGVIGGVLAGATLLSPFADISPGVVTLYGLLCLLFLVNLRAPQADEIAVRCFAIINAVSLALGLLLVANVQVIDRAIVTWYSAFRPGLAEEMVVLGNKPVLTFGTHSMAAFAVYVFFALSLWAHEAGRGRGWLFAAVGHVLLLTQFHSTTATIFLLMAAVQLIWIPVRRASQPIRNAAVGVVTILFVVAGIWLVAQPAAVDALRAQVLGDSRHGFIVRYGANGLLASNLDYLTWHPFAPIGVTFSSTLYLGDSGLVVNALRGSLPLVVAVYGGIIAFALGSLQWRLAGIWLGCVIAAFEIGFTPLQYFRFLALLPLIVAFLNAIHPDATAVSSSQPWSLAGDALWRRRWFLASAMLAGAALGGVTTRVNACCFTTEVVLRVGPPNLLEVSRRWYADQVEAMAKNPAAFEAVLRSDPKLIDELGMPPEVFRKSVVVEQRDEGRSVAIKMAAARADTIETIANGLADGVIAAAHQRFGPIVLPPERTLKLEVTSRASAQGRPIHAIPVAMLLGALTGVLIAGAWAVGARGRDPAYFRPSGNRRSGGPS